MSGSLRMYLSKDEPLLVVRPFDKLRVVLSKVEGRQAHHERGRERPLCDDLLFFVPLMLFVPSSHVIGFVRSYLRD
jgi:hypothetical protein